MPAGVGMVIYMINSGRSTLGYIASLLAVDVFVVLVALQEALALGRFSVIVGQIARSRRLDDNDRTTLKTRKPKASSRT